MIDARAQENFKEEKTLTSTVDTLKHKILMNPSNNNNNDNNSNHSENE